MVFLTTNGHQTVRSSLLYKHALARDEIVHPESNELVDKFICRTEGEHALCVRK